MATSLISLLGLSCSSSPPEITSDQAQDNQPDQTRLVQHMLGETQVPLHSQRIVALHDSIILAALIDLGIKPIAATTYAAQDGIPFRGVTAEEVEGIEVIGNEHLPNLETLVSLKPDLILGTHLSTHQDIYQNLSNIAPTVLIDFRDFPSFKKHFLHIAEIVGRIEVANKVLDDYETRVLQLREALGERLDDIQLSILAVYSVQLETINRGIVWDVISDVGLNLIPLQQELIQKDNSLPFSLETLPDHDGDIMFVINYPGETVDSVLQNPIWQQLQVSRNKRLHLISPQRWSGWNPRTANLILDDLYKYLVEEWDPESSESE